MDKFMSQFNKPTNANKDMQSLSEPLSYATRIIGQ